MHIVQFTSPNRPGVLYIDIIYVGGGKWNINFSGAYHYSGVSTIESSWSRIQSIQLGGEYQGPEYNGQCADGNQMSVGLWSQNLSLGVSPYNTQNGPTLYQDYGFHTETGPNGYFGWSLACQPGG